MCLDLTSMICSLSSLFLGLKYVGTLSHTVIMKSSKCSFCIERDQVGTFTFAIFALLMLRLDVSHLYAI